MNKKIIISANSSWNIYNFRMNLIKKLSEKYEVIILSPQDKFTQYILDQGYKHVDLQFDRHSKNLFSNFYLFLQYLRLFYTYKPDAFLGFTIKPNIFGTLASIFFLRIKVFNFITGLGSFYFNRGFFHSLILILYKIVFFKSTIIFFQNKNDQNFFITKNIINFNKSFLINGSGIDLEFFNNKNKNFLKSDFIFLCISRINPDKGILEFVKSAELIKKEFPNIKFKLLGSFENIFKNSRNLLTIKKSIKEKVVEHISFTEDVRPYLEISDCLVLLSYREGTSRALLEGAALSKPLIATNVPGCNNVVINNYNGFLCESNNFINAYEVMKKMLNLSIEERTIMGKNSRKLVEANFEINKVSNSILNIIYRYI